jgi:HSP20 family protein
MYPTRSKVYGTPVFNKFLGGFSDADLSKFFGVDSFASAPAVNVSENEKGFKIEVAAPGFSKENFSLHIEKRTLSIKGEHKAETSEEKETNTEKYTRREFQLGSFERKFTLPENVDQENIEAKYENGILSITILRLEEVKQVKEIHVA